MIHCDRCGVRIKDMWQTHQYTSGDQFCTKCDHEWTEYCRTSKIKDWMRDNPK